MQKSVDMSGTYFQYCQKTWIWFNKRLRKKTTTEGQILEKKEKAQVFCLQGYGYNNAQKIHFREIIEVAIIGIKDIVLTLFALYKTGAIQRKITYG